MGLDFGVVGDAGADAFAGDGTENIAALFVVEHDDVDVVFHAVVHGLGVHDLEVLSEDVFEGDFGVADGVWVTEGIGGIDAVDFCGFEDDFGVDFAGTECGGGVGGDEGAAGAGGEDHDAAFFEMSEAASADEGFGDAFHADGALEASLDTGAFECVLEGEAVDDGGEHSHVVGGGGNDALADFGKLPAAKNIAAAADDGELYAVLDDVADLIAD